MNIERGYVIIYGTIGLLVCVIHLLIISFLLWFPSLRQKNSNRLFMNLNIGHVVTGLTLFIVVFCPDSNLLTYINYAGYAHGNISLVMLTLDRCFMIRRPFLYQTLPYAYHVALLVTSPIVALSIFIEALVNRLHTPSHLDRFTMTLFVYAIIAVTIFLLALNTLVYMTLLKQKRLIRSCLVPTSNSNTANVDNHNDNASNRDVTRIGFDNNSTHNTNNTKSTKATLKWRKSDVFSFYICIGCVFTSTLLWTPELIRQCIWLFGSEGKLHEGVFVGFSRILLNLNPICDALILVWFNRELKDKLRGVLKLIVGGNKAPSNNNVVSTSHVATVVSHV